MAYSIVEIYWTLNKKKYIKPADRIKINWVGIEVSPKNCFFLNAYYETEFLSTLSHLKFPITL